MMVDMKHDGNDGEEYGNVCVRQHVVPRFILSWFSPDCAKTRRNKHSKSNHKVIVRESPGGNVRKRRVIAYEFIGRSLYSELLDQSWARYENSMYRLGERIMDTLDESDTRDVKIGVGDFVDTILPFMAGTVARARGAAADMTKTSWNIEGTLKWLGTDAIRVLVMESMLTLLTSAKIGIVTPEKGRFILPGDGYMFQRSTGTLTIPVSCTTALRAVWRHDDKPTADDVEDGSVVLQVSKEYPAREHRLSATQSRMVIASRKHDLDDATPLNGENMDIGGWIVDHMEPEHIHDWCRIVPSCITGVSYVDPSDEDGLDIAFHGMESHGRWAPPVIVSPSLTDEWSVTQWSVRARRTVVETCEESAWGI